MQEGKTFESDQELPISGFLMKQIFSGTIHNIGNIVTVMNLAVAEMELVSLENQRNNLNRFESILELIKTNLDAKLELDETFLEVLVKQLEQCASVEKKVYENQCKMLHSMEQKLSHTRKILEMQQSLVSGIGTKSYVSIHEILNNALALMEERARKHNVNINLSLEDDGFVHVEPSLLIQVFINLISNSCDALSTMVELPIKQIFIHCSLDVSVDPNELVCTVSDNGPGIPNDIAEHVFEFGYSTKSDKPLCQRGIGLAFSKHSVESLGGKLELMNPFKQEGTTFKIILPVSKS